jgi:hypothetical protein
MANAGLLADDGCGGASLFEATIPTLTNWRSERLVGDRSETMNNRSQDSKRLQYLFVGHRYSLH